jgi:hypothetical protein
MGMNWVFLREYTDIVEGVEGVEEVEEISELNSESLTKR